MQVPPRWIAGHCAQQIPEENPTRRMLCGMMAAVDSSVANMTAAYKRLGLWPETARPNPLALCGDRVTRD